MSNKNDSSKVESLEGEIWKDVVGYEGFYRVSTLGRIKSLARKVPLPNGGVYPVREKILKTTFNSYYYQVILSVNAKHKTELVHRLVLISHVGVRPKDMEACHNDGNPRNNRLDNLRWDTKLSNHRDKINHGRSLKGKSNNRNALSGKEQKLLGMYRSGRYTVKQIAAYFKVTTTAIYTKLRKLKREI